MGVKTDSCAGSWQLHGRLAEHLCRFDAVGPRISKAADLFSVTQAISKANSGNCVKHMKAFI